MESFARLASPIADTPIELIDARRSRKFGFFKLLERHFGGARHSGSSTSLLTPLHRVCSLARGHKVRAIVIEEIEDSAELKDENEDLAQLGWWQKEHRVLRISFFSAAIPEELEPAAAAPGESSPEPDLATARAKAFVATVPEKSFIGYAIWKHDSGDCPLPEDAPRHVRVCDRVYEAVLPPPPEQYIHVRKLPRRECRVAGRKFEAVGLPFYEQNRVTNVCAHAAIRTLASCFGRDMSFREMNEFVKARGEDFTERGGLFIEEIKELVEHMGIECDPISYNPWVKGAAKEPPAVQFQRFVYGSIESGFPSIIIFGENGAGGAVPKEGYLHAVTVFGHTFNRHMWVPRVEFTRFHLEDKDSVGFIPSDLWAGSFVGHDDTLGPHFTIPRHYMRGMRSAVHDHPQYQNVTEGVAHVFCARPSYTKMKPIDAEVTALGWLTGMLDLFEPYLAKEWGGLLLGQRNDSQLVLRPLLISKEEYLKHLAGLQGWDRKVERIPLKLRRRIQNGVKLDKFWMVEISLQELFPTNWRKVGEVLINPQFTKDDFGPESDALAEEASAELTAEDFDRAVVGVRLPGIWIRPLPVGPDTPELEWEVVDCPITTHSILFGCEDKKDRLE